MDELNGTPPVNAIICVDEDANAIICINDNDDDDEIEPLTENPFFYVHMHKSSLSYSQTIPSEFSELLPASKTAVPVILIRGGRSWEMIYTANHASHKRLANGWKSFVTDNKLKVGDICLFELMSSEVTMIEFKVQVLGGELPPELEGKKAAGTLDSPLLIK